MNGESVDLTAANIARLKELFPEILTDGEKIDFDMLKAVLGGEVDSENERYQFTWHGKKKMIAGAQKPSKGTLRPDKEKSKNFDTTENLYIEGDNLEVLKLLQKSYNNKVKMIYIDPPYNTGKDFIYKDNFKNSIKEYLDLSGQTDSAGNILSTNSDIAGRFHTDWLNMIYPRIKVARNLLSDNGLMFISIDDAEFMNLKKVMDEVFGDENKIAELVWDLGTGTQAGHFTRSHEYVLVYAKNRNLVSNFKGGEGIIQHSALKKISAKNPPSEFKFKKGTKFEAPHGTELFNSWGGSEVTNLKSGRMISDKGYLKEDVVLEAGWPMKNQMINWFSGEETFDSKGQKVLEFYFNSSGVLTYKKDRSVVNPATVLKGYGSTKTGSSRITELFKSEVFDFPKPVNLLKFLIKLCTNENEIVMDFFSGSATIADAILQLNFEENKNRKFILVQFPEKLEETLKTAKDGAKHTISKAIKYLDEIGKPRTLTEIGQQRIRLVMQELQRKKEESEQNSNLFSEENLNIDFGFKVLKLDTSNIREWNVDFVDLEGELSTYDTPFIENRTELDVVYEIMLKQGLELTYPIETFEVKGQAIYDIAGGSLFVCLAQKITTEIAQAIITRRDEQGTDTSSVIFSDAGFATDSDKLNCLEILKDAGYPEDNLLTL